MILFEESSPSLLVKYDTLYNNIKQIRTWISKKLDSFPLIMERNYSIFWGPLFSEKRKLTRMNTGSQRRNREKCFIKISGIELWNLKARQVVQSKLSNLLCLKSWLFDPSRVHLYVYNNILVSGGKKNLNEFNQSSSPDYHPSAHAEHIIQLQQDTFWEAGQWNPHTCLDEYCREHGWWGQHCQPLSEVPR